MKPSLAAGEVLDCRPAGPGGMHFSWPTGPLLFTLLLRLLGSDGSGDQATTHSLRYDFTALSQPGPGQSPYDFSGYLDDQPFLWCCKEGRRAKPQASWSRDPGIWEKLILRLKARAQHLVIILRRIMEHNNQSQESHILQTTVFCELLGDQTSRGHWQYNYDGKDFLLSTLESFNSSQSKPDWETEKEQSFLSRSCVYPLRKYLEAGAGAQPEITAIDTSSRPKQLPIWIICGLLATAVVMVGAVGTFLWKKWKQGRTAGMQREIYIPMPSYHQRPDYSV